MTLQFSILSTTLTMSMLQLEPQQQQQHSEEEDEDEQRQEDVTSLHHDAVSVAPKTAVRLHYIQRYGHSAILPCRSARRIVHLEDDDDAMSASSVEIVFEQDDCLLGDCESTLFFSSGNESRAAQSLASALQTDEVVLDNVTNTISRPEEELISFTSLKDHGFGPLSEQHPSSQSLYVSKNVDKDDGDDSFETTSSSFMRKKQRASTAASASAQLLVPDSETSRCTLRTDNTRNRVANAEATGLATATAARSKRAAAQSAVGVPELAAKRDTLNDDDSDDGLVLSAARTRQSKCCRLCRSGTRIGYSYCSCAVLLLMVIVVITVQIVWNSANDNETDSRNIPIRPSTPGWATPAPTVVTISSPISTMTQAPVQLLRRSVSPTAIPTTARADELVSSFPTATNTAPSLAPINSTTVAEGDAAEMTETTTILPSVPPSSSPTTPESTTTPTTTLYFTTTQQLYKAVDAYYYYYSYHNNTLYIKNESTIPVPLDVAALQYGYPIGTWDVSRLSNFSHVFSMHRPSTIQGQKGRNNNARSPAFGLHDGDDLSSWNVSRATTLHAMFMGAVNCTGRGIEQWQVSRVTDFSYTFAKATRFIGMGLEHWNTSSATNMEAMFQEASSYVGMGLEAWDTSRVTNLKHTFQKCPWFRGNVSKWNVGKVESFEGTFEYCLFFDSDLSLWDVSNAKSLQAMFKDTWAFVGGNLSAWNTAKVTNMREMFYNAGGFNGDLSTWNVSRVHDASGMFQDAKAFNHSLCSWGLGRYDNLHFENGTSWNVTNMFANSGCPNTSDPIVSSSSMTGPLCWNCDS